MLATTSAKPVVHRRLHENCCCCRYQRCQPQNIATSTQKILCLSIIAIFTNACYTTISPILPLELTHYYNESQNDDGQRSSSEEYYLSLIFIFFSLGSMVTPPLISRHFETSCGGTMKIMSIAMIVMALLFYCLGSIFRLYNSWIMWQPEGGDGVTEEKSNNSNHLLIGLICTTQFCIGGLLSIITTGYYASATLIRASNPDRAISFLETAVGIGYILGPLIGSWIYEEMGYVHVYRVASAIMVLLGIATFKCISPLFTTKEVFGGDEDYEDYGMERAFEDTFTDVESSLNLTSGFESRVESKDSMINHCHERQPLLTSRDVTMKTLSSPTNSPTIMHLLGQPKILVSAMCITWCNVAWTFVEPLLSNRLDRFFHIGKKEIGAIFSLSNMTYVPAVFLLQFAFAASNMRRRRLIILLSIASTPVAVLLIGSNYIQCLTLGVSLLGILPTPVWIMLLPSMQKDALDIYPDSGHRRVANDQTAGIYNSFMILGQVFGYMIGPTFNATVGFRITTWIVGGLIFAQASLYYYFVLSDSNRQPIRKA